MGTRRRGGSARRGGVASRDDAVRERRRKVPRGAKGAGGVSPLVRSMPGGVLAYQTSLLYLVRNL